MVVEKIINPKQPTAAQPTIDNKLPKDYHLSYQSLIIVDIRFRRNDFRAMDCATLSTIDGLRLGK